MLTWLENLNAMTAPQENFERLLASLGESLKLIGFARKGYAFKVFSTDNCGIIEFQKSDKSSRDKIIFTINLGVVYGRLLESSFNLAKAGIVDCQLRQRIGKLLPDRPDKWWEVTGSSDLGSLTSEIAELLLGKGTPFIQTYLDISAIVALWKSGQAPGLTALQRDQFLSNLATPNT